MWTWVQLVQTIGEVDSEDADIFYVLKEFDQELVEK